MTTKTYNIISQALCSLAGGSLGFIVLGAHFIIPGLVVGTIVGYLLKKAFANKFFSAAEE